MSQDRIEKLQQFLKANSKDCFINHALALEYVKIGNEAKAQQYFEANLTCDPNYIATYFHLGKLYERIQLKDNAIVIYEKGMRITKELNDIHTYSELQNAYEDLVY